MPLTLMMQGFDQLQVDHLLQYGLQMEGQKFIQHRFE